MLNLLRVVAVVLGLSATAAAESSREGAAVERMILDNGVTVILVPVPGIKRVGLETVYRVGFVDEPAGQTQIAHLVEHAVCMSGTASFAPHASFDQMNLRGMANAETLGHMTHYDLEGPAEDLETLLKVEAERLGSLAITADVLKAEVPRVYGETDAVESSPIAPLFKHGIMAAHQAWRFGRETALVRGGLAEIPLDQVRAFHAATYTPDRLTVVVCGGFEAGPAKAMIRKHLGAVPARKPAAKQPIAWEKVQRTMTVQWDARVTAVVVAWAPPKSPRDRVQLSLLGDLVVQRLASDPACTKVARMALCSGRGWPVGEMPFMVYATLKAGADPDQAALTLRERMVALCAQPFAPMELEMLRQGAAATTTAPDPELVRQQGAMFAKMRPGMAPEQAEGMVVLQGGLMIAMREMLMASTGADEQVMTGLATMTEKDLTDAAGAATKGEPVVVILRQAKRD